MTDVAPFPILTGFDFRRLAQLQIRVAGRLRLGPWSASTRFGLRRVLETPLAPANAKIPIEVRPYVPSDLDAVLPLDAAAVPADKLEIAWRRAFFQKRAQGCFVAVDQRNGKPCYMQWLLHPTDNAFIRRLGGFPQLGSGEALLENAYTPTAYRGLGIMSTAMALIAERAADSGAREVLTFVDEHNIASLKGCQRAGFHPHLLHQRTQIGFGIYKRDSFALLAPDDPRRSARF